MDNEHPKQHENKENTESLVEEALAREFGFNAIQGTAHEVTATTDEETATEVRIDEADRQKVTIEFIKDLEVLAVTNEDGERTQQPVGLSRREANAFFEKLMRLHEALGSGEHMFADAVEKSGLTLESIKRFTGKLASRNVIPENLFTIKRQTEFTGSIIFGDVAFAIRNAEQSDIELYDKDKKNIAHHDHAIIQLAHERLYMPLHQKEMMLATHIIDTLSGFAGDVRLETILERVWQAMTVEERRSMVNKPEDIFSGPSKIKSQTVNILRHLTNQLGITRERTGEVFHILRHDFLVSLHMEPSSQYDPQLGSIAPAGISKEAVRRMKGEAPLSQETLMMAHEILDVLQQGASIDQETAIQYLTFITQPEGKRAIKDVAKEHETLPKTSAALRAAIEARIERSLREGHTSALEFRTVAGRSWLRQVYQTGGELPTSSKAKIEDKRWRIDRPTKKYSQ